MRIILDKKDIVEYLNIFLRSKTLRDLILEKLKNEDFDELPEENNDEKLMILNCGNPEYKKRRGRPKKMSKEKIKNQIKIEEGQNLDVDI